MAKELFQVEGMTSNALLSSIEDIIKKNLSTIPIAQNNEDHPELITRKQVSELFGVTLVTIHAWTNAGILQAYKIGNKVRYKRAEALQACKPLKAKGGLNE